MAKLLRAKAIRELAKLRGKKVGCTFLLGLEGRVETIVNKSCTKRDSRKILQAEDIVD